MVTLPEKVEPDPIYIDPIYIKSDPIYISLTPFTFNISSLHTMNDEQVFFQQDEITVTNARFVVGSQTFAMRNITSVRSEKIDAKVEYPGYLMMAGIVVALVGFFGAGIAVGVLGIAILAGGIYLAWNQDDNFAVLLTTSAGEVSAYQSKDKQHIASIVKALNDSIVARG